MTNNDMKPNILTEMMMVAAIAGAVSSCSGNKPVAEKTPAINLENLDTTVTPGTDFYQYATGGWQKNNPLKPEYSRFGAFDVIAENNKIRLNDLFKSLADTQTEAGTVERKIADLYNLGMDSTRLNEEGAKPVAHYLAEIEQVNTVEDFAYAMGQMAKYNVSGIYGCGVDADLMNSNNNAMYLAESGLKMGNRDYYLLAEHQALRDGYKALLVKLFTLSGIKCDIEKYAQDAYDIEMTIAEPYWSMVRQRDIASQYNPMSASELAAKYPALHLDIYFQQLGIAPETAIVMQPDYFEAIDKMVAGTEMEKMRHYLQACVLLDACENLSDEFYTASFEFFSRQMSGIQEEKPRWKRAMSAPNSLLGEAVGKMYVEKYFPEADKERMLTMVKNIQTALGQHIQALDWMTDATKAKAIEKLNAFTVKIGYPDKWKDYSSLNINPKDSYYQNLLNASAWYVQDNLSKLGKPVDKTEWGMTPQTVNAYYNPTTNEICFPAGILQPPFFNTNADDAVNYGAIGAVISHEMTHGFDDQGRLFDKDGNMNGWWQPEDEAAFNAKTEKLVEQFNQVEVLPGVFANGKASLGENIADQGGLRIAYTALQNSFAGNHPEPVDGFTAEQRFYLGYATVWAQNITDEEIQRRTLLDVHSIGENRVNVTVRNLDTFFEAFGIKEGDAMFRPFDDRVVIW